MKAAKKMLKKTLEKVKDKAKKHDGRKKNILAGLLFLLIGGGMTVFSAVLIWDRVFTAPDLEKILPERDLIALINIEEPAGIPLVKEKNPAWDQRWHDTIQSVLGVNLEETLPWRGSRAGLAAYAIPKGVEPDEWGLIGFVSLKNSKLAGEYLAARNPIDTEKFSNVPLWHFTTPRDEYCTLFSSYLACSPVKLLLQNMIEAHNGSVLKIAASKDFQAAAAELPRTHALRIFARSRALFDAVPDLPQKERLLPLVENITTLGFTLRENTFGHDLQTSLLLLRSQVGAEKDLSNEQIAFNGNTPSILRFLPTETNAFVWGNDIAEDIVDGLKYFAEVDPAFEIVARGELRQWVREFFGGEITWEDDLLPLMTSEFAAGTLEANGGFAVFQTGDPEFNEAKLERMKTGLMKMSARFAPKIVSHTLQDGTVVSEVFPNEDAVQIAEEDLSGGGKSFLMETKNSAGETALSVGLAARDGMLVVASPKEEAAAILNGETSSDLAQNLPTEFAGSSEEVFAFVPTFLERWIPKELLPQFTRVSGKFVSTPVFFRLMGEVEL